ncbi:DUF1178 family protein [uncultured Methylobacterium sp.]|uniref:DUF1178 family protein n=1 Tax=uncultured Methylobacterium sp. TaxID=157278 RepID=UPI0035CBEA85
MIRYTLACEAGHGFESWFPSSESYDDQAARGLVTCPHCGSAKVAKAMMAPSIGRAASGPTEPNLPAVTQQPETVSLIAEPDQRLRAMLKAFRDHVTANADDVGTRFPEEARRIHYGEAGNRAIYGEASPAEARSLIDEGIAVALLPVLPDDRN